MHKILSWGPTGDGKRLADIQREQEARIQQRKLADSQNGSPQALNKNEDRSEAAVELFYDISRWLQVHTSYTWFQGQVSIESGKLLQHIQKDIFPGKLDPVDHGFLQAMLLAEDVLANGHSRPWDAVRICIKGLGMAILDCSRSSYSSTTELDEIRRQLQECAWVSFLIA